MTEALRVDNVVKKYHNVRALDNVSFSVPAGAVTALLGPNGAGKTTLFQILTGLFAPDHGTVKVFGADFRRNPVAALRQLGIVFQQPALDLDLTAAQNLRFHARLHGLARSESDAAIAAWLERFGLASMAGTRARELSGGTRRKVELARAFITRPKLLLLDEPTQGLDPLSRHELVSDVFALAREGNIAVLWATHLVGEVQKANDVIVLAKGRIIGNGHPADLLRTAGTADLEQAFLSLVRDRQPTGTA
jgi:ABC-2 type transport system ATP-binding protein